MRNSQPKSIIISPQAKEDVNNILLYLSQNWNQKVVDDFLQKLEIFYYLVSINPRLFGYFNNKRTFVNTRLQNKILFITETKKQKFK